MKKLILFSAFMLFTLLASAQVKFGVRGGFSSANVDADNINFINSNMDTSAIGIADVKGGYHIGLFLQGQIGKFFIQPEVLFNSNRADFTLRNLADPDGREEILKEHYQYLDIPVMMGLKLGALRLQGGPVGHLYLDSSSDLFEIEGYRQKFEKMTYGWQTGVGLDIWNVALDVKYEGNFTKFGDHLAIGDQEFKFDDAPSRWIFSLGIAF